jgi:glycosyltransferase involved in cell wall biosynthesis
MRIKVVILMDDIGFGGAERVAVNLANYLPKDRYDVEIHAQDGPCEYAIAPDVRVRMVSPLSPDLDGRITALARHWSEFTPDIVISNWGEINVEGLAARCMSGRRFPMICVEQTVASAYLESLEADSDGAHLPPGQVYRKFLEAGYRELYPHADALVAPHLEIAQDLARLTGLKLDQIELIHNPAVPEEVIELAKEQSPHDWYSDPGRTVVLGVGRLSPEKGFDLLIDAFALARRERPDLYLLIAGVGDEHESLAALISANGLDKEALLLGAVLNPYAHMARADIMVLPSRLEGMPIVLGEALACGARVVCTPHTGATQVTLLSEGQGRVAEGPTAQALSDAILAELADPAVPAGPRQVPISYAVGPAIRRYDQLISSLLAANESSRSLGDKDAVRRMVEPTLRLVPPQAEPPSVPH